MTSMAVADGQIAIDVSDAVLVSPASAGQARPAPHRTPSTHHRADGVHPRHSDPFGTIDELRTAAALIPAPTEIVEITGARHDLGSKTLNVPELAVTAAERLLR